MKKQDIMQMTEIREHTKRCLFDDFNAEYDTIINYLEKSENLEEFANLIFSNEKLKRTQGYAELSKDMPGHWYRVREMFGNLQFKTSSDAGSVAIGNDYITLLIPNGYGDGTSRVGIWEDMTDFNEHMMTFNPMCIKALKPMYIYDDDCATDNVVATLSSGTYYTYSYEGFVAIVKYY